MRQQLLGEDKIEDI